MKYLKTYENSNIYKQYIIFKLDGWLDTDIYLARIIKVNDDYFFYDNFYYYDKGNLVSIEDDKESGSYPNGDDLIIFYQTDDLGDGLEHLRFLNNMNKYNL